MFCAKCGKEIDNDSTFCPYCGQKVGEPVRTNVGSTINSFREKDIQKVSVLQGIICNKWLYGSVLAFVTVAIVIFGVVKLAGGKKTAPEVLYEMSWEETSEFSMDDFADLLDSRDIRYAKNSRSHRFNAGYDEDLFITLYNDSVMTKEFEPFFGGDCIFYYDTSRFESGYIICYKTSDEFEKGMEAIEKDIEKKCIGCEKMDFEDHYYHLIEMSKKNVDICIENAVEHVYYLSSGVRTLEEYEAEVRNEYSDSDISVCRMISVNSGMIDNDFLQNNMSSEFGENYSQQMFEPYSYFCNIYIKHELEEESVIKENLKKFLNW